MIKNNPIIYEDKIFYYEGILNNSNRLISLIEDTNSQLSETSLISPWKEWKSSGYDYIFGEKKTTNLEGFNLASDNIKRIYDDISNAIDICANDYAYINDIRIGLRMPISISKYYVGTYMGAHSDSSPHSISESISAVLYLNDDYIGGELNFPNHDIKIKPSSGSIVIFPSTLPFLHESLKIISGIKYISPAFWHTL